MAREPLKSLSLKFGQPLCLENKLRDNITPVVPTEDFINPESYSDLMAPPISLGEIILVEDNRGDIRLTQEIFKEEDVDSTINVVSDGEELLDHLYHSDALSPDLILLNWNSLQTDGGEILEEIEETEEFKDTPIAILSGSEAELDLIKDREPEADAYITKPCHPDDLETVLDGS